jgi:hypothetical protein
MPVIKVTRHDSFEAAIEATGFDCSYNPAEARSYIKSLLRPDEGSKVDGIYSTAQGAILYVYDSPKYGRLLNKFSPFSGGISSRPLCVGMIHGDEIAIVDQARVDKGNLKRRRELREMGFILTEQEPWFTC